MQAPPLVDTYGRVHNSLRISVTDRCDVRCFYCMPETGVQFMPREEVLRFEEIERFARIAAGLGVDKLRITGGEPLVRRDLPVLVRSLAAIPEIRELNIGHFLVGEAIFCGLDASIRRMRALMDEARARMDGRNTA